MTVEPGSRVPVKLCFYKKEWTVGSRGLERAMISRNVTDTGGRTWACRQDDLMHGKTPEGQDVSILCTTASVTIPVRLTVGWQWTKMADNGLARLISDASPLPRKSEFVPAR